MFGVLFFEVEVGLSLGFGRLFTCRVESFVILFSKLVFSSLTLPGVVPETLADPSECDLLCDVSLPLLVR